MSLASHLTKFYEQCSFLRSCLQVVREGTKRVVLVNFQEITNSMNRSPEHLLSFMLAELGDC